MLIPKIDMVSTESLQAALERSPHIGGTAINTSYFPFRIESETELRRDHDFVTAITERASKQLLIDIGAVDFSSIKEIDAEFDGAVQSRNILAFIRYAIHRWHAGNTGHTHGAKAESRDGETLCTERALLHETQTPPRKSCLPSETPA